MGRRIAAIIRHGDYHQIAGAPSAHQPFPLNTDGKKHAVEAAAIIDKIQQQYGWAVAAEIDCSQMLRAWQTADIIAENLASQHDLQSFDELAERGVGCAANLTAGQIVKIIHDDPRYPELPQNWKSNSEYRLPLQGAESLLEAGKRVAEHLNRRLSEIPDDGVDRLKLFVGHGAAFRHAAFHLGLMEYDDIARLSMFHGRPVFVELLQDGRWSHITGDWKVRAINSEFRD
ncbi:MAG: histidine phosphatase family protein [Gammaproteobacteria bacterium]|jgi:2,3-bisphosphoglycerate-dependent phosphoglycerate mutase|nr:histidine phosphatase family protein [Gammaproteobacteria bacterium]MBT3721831.1 histidine phosphatase family protein [Gammaproteobacteria bacterium]MBT4078480.1 histidine phosphatase family protein [Gammaproteobacteria bacterium]MBT4196111.1 histidine phosphatase family protein [Gammaproteobacteria bacterium]MBT4451773.1 histidine phosphatase family protein [Gammaproteobacteria bacterium]